MAIRVLQAFPTFGVLQMMSYSSDLVQILICFVLYVSVHLDFISLQSVMLIFLENVTTKYLNYFYRYILNKRRKTKVFTCIGQKRINTNMPKRAQGLSSHKMYNTPKVIVTGPPIIIGPNKTIVKIRWLSFANMLIN